MASKKYLVRTGFIVMLAILAQDGSTKTRTYEGGEEVTLDDADAALHQHKLEFANAKDRDAALVTEKDAKVTAAATGSPVELVQMLVAALSQAQAAAAPVQTPAAA